MGRAGAVIHGFQKMTMAIKYCPRPVVAAPFGLTFGGGAEICLHAARRQATRRPTSAWSRLASA